MRHAGVTEAPKNHGHGGSGGVANSQDSAVLGSVAAAAAPAAGRQVGGHDSTEHARTLLPRSTTCPCPNLVWATRVLILLFPVAAVSNFQLDALSVCGEFVKECLFLSIVVDLDASDSAKVLTAMDVHVCAN